MSLRPFLAIILLWFAGLMAAAQFAKIAVPFPEVAALYPVSEAAAGLLLSSVSLVGAILGFWSGAFVTRLGPQRALYGGLLVAGLLSVLQAAPLPFGWMLASRVAEGAAHLVIVVAAPVLIARIAPPHFQAASMAFWSTFFTATFALVAWIGLPFVAEHGARSLFLVHGIVTLLLMPACALVMQRGPALDTAGAEHLGSILRPALPSPAGRKARIVAPGIAWFCYTFTFVAVVAILPSILPPEIRTVATSLLPILGITVSLTLGPVLLRFVPGLWVVSLGFLLAALAIAVVGLGAGIVWCVFAVFAAFGLIQCGSFAAVPELNERPRDQALAHGIIAQAGNLGNLIGTPILLSLADIGGVAALLSLTAVLYGLAIAILWLLGRHGAHPIGS